jgi:hypothetical protein
MKNAPTSIFAAGFLAALLYAAPQPDLPPGLAAPAALGNQKLAQLGLVDVTAKPFLADPTGQRDSTEALQKAIYFARDKRMITFFPLGTYLVSNTLVAVKSTNRLAPCVLVGERRQGSGKSAARPVILLAPHSSGFGDPAHPKFVVYFWSHSSWGATRSQPNISMNQVFVGIDVTIGKGNAGAVGISHDGAQGSAIQDSTIDATYGFAGVEGAAGSGGSHAGVTVIGGRYGLDFRQSQENNAPTITGFTLIGQTEAAILTDTTQTLTAVGLKIVSKSAGPLIVASSVEGEAWRGQLSLVDSEIVFEKPSAKNVGISSRRSLYLNNVFVKNAAKLVSNPDGSELAANPSGWMRVGEYAHGVRPPLFQPSHPWEAPADQWDKKYQYEAPVYIDGVRSLQDVIEGVEKGQQPPADLESRHIWGADFPSWQSPSAVNVKAAPYKAKGDGETDDTAALQRAIDENEIVFLPKGRYSVTRTIRLKPNTKLVGVAQHLSMIVVRGKSGDFGDSANPKPIILTADDRDGTAVLSFCGLETTKEATGAYALHWRTGRNSILRTVLLNLAHGEVPARNSPYVIVSGHGGGRWYNFYAEFWVNQAPGYRQLLVEGTSEPLRFYQCNPEHSRGDANMEIRNSRYVSIYGLKCEGNHPALWVRDSDHVRVFGHGGCASAYEHTALYRIERTPNFLVANAVDRPRLAGVRANEEHFAGRGVDPSLWHMIDDAPAGGAQIKTTPMDRPVLYRRGVPRGE